MIEQTVTNAEELSNLQLSTPPMTESQLGAQFLKAGLIDREQLKQIIVESHRKKKSFLDTMVDLGLVAHENSTEVLSSRLGIPLVHVAGMTISGNVVHALPTQVIEAYKAFPIGLVNNRLYVAMPNPCDIDAVHAISFASNHLIEVVMAPLAEINSLMERYLFTSEEDDILSEFNDNLVEKKTISDSVQILEEKALQQPVVKFVDSLLHKAVIQGVSDINIRPTDDGADVYYRLDGKMQLQRSLTQAQAAPITTRIKIISGMNIAERRLPQDGATAFDYNKKRIDFRVSCIPMVNGESIVIRVLDSSKGLVNLDALGLPVAEIQRMRKLLAHSYGIFLVTGPTGSGKSTTLYAVVQERLKNDPHIITVEDPVEYRLEGVEQIQIKTKIGYSFAEALRHILRHDPDEILIGEMRDHETAEIAIKAALTGHFVMSTLHTNDAASSVTRLVDMGIEPYLINSALVGVLAQRLIRRICEKCKQADPDELHLKAYFELPDDFPAMTGRGCEHCHHTGYKGRMMVGELLEMSPALKALVTASADADALKDQAASEGMVSLTDNAIQLAREGRTTLQEVFRIKAE